MISISQPKKAGHRRGAWRWLAFLAWRILSCGSVALAAQIEVDPLLVPPSRGGPVTLVAPIALPEGRVLIIGGFTRVGALSQKYIARLNRDGSVDEGFAPDFRPPTGAIPEQVVVGASLASDGRLLVWGDFTTVDSVPRAGLAILTSDGSLDTRFDPGPGSDSTFGLAPNTFVQVGEKFLVGGSFSSFSGQPGQLVRLIADGTVDGAFTVELGYDDAVLKPTIFTVIPVGNGKAFVIGRFDSYNGAARPSLALLNADGSLDSTFNVGLSFPFRSRAVNSLSLDTSGRIYITGNFDQVDGIPVRNIARLRPDGTLDELFQPPDPKVGVQVFPRPDGLAWYLPDSFATSISLLQPDGSRAEELKVPGGKWIGAWMPGLLPDGSLLVFGEFKTLGGLNRDGLAQINVGGNTSVTVGFAPEDLEALESAGSITVKVTRSGDVSAPLTVGYSVAGETARPGIDFQAMAGQLVFAANERERRLSIKVYDNTEPNPTRTVALTLSSDSPSVFVGRKTELSLLDDDWAGRVDPAYRALPDTDGSSGLTAWSMIQRPDAKSFVFGDRAGSNVLLRLNADGSLDPTFIAEHVGFPKVVTADGGLLCDHAPYANEEVVRLDPSGKRDPTFKLEVASPGFRGIQGILREPDGDFIVFGLFATINGAERTSIARIHPDGSVDPGFDAGESANNWIGGAVLQPDGKIVVAGDFTRFAGTPRGGLARLLADGRLDTSFVPNVAKPDSGTLQTLAIQADGSILWAPQGGATFSPNAIHGVVRIRSDGRLDAAFRPGNALATTRGSPPFVNSVVVQPDGRILLAGLFDRCGGKPCDGIARFLQDGSLDAEFDAGPTGLGALSGAILLPDHELLVFGPFDQFGGIPREGVAKLMTTPRVPLKILELARLPDGANRITLQTHGEGDYALEATSDLVTWHRVSLQKGGAGTLSFDDANTQESTRFYRAARLP